MTIHAKSCKKLHLTEDSNFGSNHQIKKKFVQQSSKINKQVSQTSTIQQKIPTFTNQSTHTLAPIHFIIQ